MIDLSLFHELSEIDARTFTRGEVDIAKKLYNSFLEIDYLKDFPLNNKLVATDEEDLVRFNHMALLEKGGKDLVVLVNVLDDPPISPKFDNCDIFNTKAMLFNSKVIFNELSKTLNNGNFLVINICDRFGHNLGIEKAVNTLIEFLDRDYSIKALITTNDYTTLSGNAVFFGCQGIYRPAVFVGGKIVRTSELYKGLDPAGVLSSIIRSLTLNISCMDTLQNEISEPIYVSKLLVPGGNELSTQEWGYASFVTSSVTRNPSDYLLDFKNYVEKSYNLYLNEMNSKISSYLYKRKVDFKENELTPKVYTWSEYLNELITIRGNTVLTAINNRINQILNNNSDISEDELRLLAVRYVYDNFKISDKPVIIVYYDALPENRVDITGKTDAERELMTSVTRALNLVDSSIKKRFFYPEQSFQSYFNISDEFRDLKNLIKDLPYARKSYEDRIRNAEKLNIPTVNIGGVFGVDCCDIDKDYLFEKIPNIIIKTIEKLLEE